MADGAALYATVEAYAALGDHRTGTAVDDATRAWFTDELVRRGATVRSLPWTFERYDGRARLRAAATEVAAVPISYSGTGRVSTDAPHLVELDGVGVHLGALDTALDEAAARGAEAVAVATGGGTGRLVVPNRRPVLRDGPLAVVVAGASAATIAAHGGTLTMDARVAPASSATVEGRLGRGGGDPVVVTTPLSGWFRCAGERGTGIAVALEVAGALARDHPVLVVGTTGHELEFEGLRRYLAHGTPRALAVVHCGAGLAAGDTDEGGDLVLAGLRLALTVTGEGRGGRTGERTGEALAGPLARVGFDLVSGWDTWPGEGELWRGLGVPVLSLVGGFERFHTDDDVPAAVTTPALLARVASGVVDAARVLLRAAR